MIELAELDGIHLIGDCDKTKDILSELGLTVLEEKTEHSITVAIITKCGNDYSKLLDVDMLCLIHMTESQCIMIKEGLRHYKKTNRVLNVHKEESIFRFDTINSSAEFIFGMHFLLGGMVLMESSIEDVYHLLGAKGSIFPVIRSYDYDEIMSVPEKSKVLYLWAADVMVSEISKNCDGLLSKNIELVVAGTSASKHTFHKFFKTDNELTDTLKKDPQKIGSYLINYVSIPKKETRTLNTWRNRGFRIKENCEDFIFLRNLDENFILSKEPDELQDFGCQRLINQKIVSINPKMGTFVMGSYGFLGFEFKEEKRSYYLLLALFCSEMHLYFDNRLFTCSEKETEHADCWYLPGSKNEEMRSAFLKKMEGLTMTEVLVNDGNLYMKLTDSSHGEHIIETRETDAFPMYIIYKESDVTEYTY